MGDILANGATGSYWSYCLLLLWVDIWTSDSITQVYWRISAPLCPKLRQEQQKFNKLTRGVVNAHSKSTPTPKLYRSYKYIKWHVLKKIFWVDECNISLGRKILEQIILIVYRLYYYKGLFHFLNICSYVSLWREVSETGGHTMTS